MDRKKFNSQLGILIGFLIMLSFVYILFLKIPRKVSNYKVNEEIFYEGKIVKNKFEGKGELKTSDGKYIGNFKNGRFHGKGKFVNQDYTYICDFDKDKGNKNIKIMLKDGSVYKKEGKSWKRVEENEN
ncbi:MAG: hypothetical protein E6Z21_09140 [Anaerococcus vaginalis]|nr:hypothetical protein [Anaerococcus vaginalis]